MPKGSAIHTNVGSADVNAAGPVAKAYVRCLKNTLLSESNYPDMLSRSSQNNFLLAVHMQMRVLL